MNSFETWSQTHVTMNSPPLSRPFVPAETNYGAFASRFFRPLPLPRWFPTWNLRSRLRKDCSESFFILSKEICNKSFRIFWKILSMSRVYLFQLLRIVIFFSLLLQLEESFFFYGRIKIKFHSFFCYIKILIKEVLQSKKKKRGRKKKVYVETYFSHFYFYLLLQ